MFVVWYLGCLMLAERAAELFRERFGGEPEVVAFAPGRVNLIGEHTDYNEGFVFPAAIDRGIAVAASPVSGASELVSEAEGEADSFDVRSLRRAGIGGWGAYAAGVAWALLDEGFEDLPNLRAVAVSDLPVGAGLSSSAAIELAFGFVWNELAGLEIAPKEMALLAQRAENRFVGVECGVMDQAASALGREGEAMFLDTRSLEVQYAVLPDGVEIVVCDTQTPRTLADSAYNQRRLECEAAARAMGVAFLRDASLDLLHEKADAIDAIPFVRARHVITENARCVGFLEALRRRNVLRIDALMRASHESLRDDYEVSCPELDAMAEAAWQAPGCVGARMTGAGFGGACVALVATHEAEEFIDEATAGYERKSGKEGRFLRCRAAEGARVLRRQ